DTSALGHVCAAGITFLFVVALNRALRESGWYAGGISEPDLRDYVDLVGLATICDVVPLTGINRAFVRAGLAKLSMMSRPGLSALAAIAKTTAPFTPHHLGFTFGPRINAGGRVGKCTLGMELLSTTDGALGQFLRQRAICRAQQFHPERAFAEHDRWRAGAGIGPAPRHAQSR